MIETFQRTLMYICLAALAAMALFAVVYAVRIQLSRLCGGIRRHPIASALLAPAVFCLYVYGSTKPVTPTVRGITLGSPAETPSSVSLAWKADEGREIRSNQLVRVYWRDAYTSWTLAAEDYGITNATVNGFFINRDTDWMVEIEDSGEDDE